MKQGRDAQGVPHISLADMIKEHIASMKTSSCLIQFNVHVANLPLCGVLLCVAANMLLNPDVNPCKQRQISSGYMTRINTLNAHDAVWGGAERRCDEIDHAQIGGLLVFLGTCLVVFGHFLALAALRLLKITGTITRGVRNSTLIQVVATHRLTLLGRE